MTDKTKEEWAETPFFVCPNFSEKNFCPPCDTIQQRTGKGGKGLEKQRENLLFLSWATSVIATLGSLYFSEILQYEPCKLCWFQRIFMYPMAILLLIAYLQKDSRFSRYAMVLSAIGGTISIYHYSLQKLPFLKDGLDFCGRIPCSAQYINWAGFITIPFLALVAFAIIFSISTYLWKTGRGGEKL